LEVTLSQASVNITETYNLRLPTTDNGAVVARGRLADGGVATAVRDVASAARDVDTVARGEALTVTPVGRLALSSLAAEVLFIFFLGEPEHTEIMYRIQENGSIEPWSCN
jgi:hypothetical protein